MSEAAKKLSQDILQKVVDSGGGDLIPDVDCPDTWSIDEQVMEDEFRPLVEGLVELARKHDVPLHITIEYGFTNESGYVQTSRNTTHVPGSRPGPLFDDIRRVTVGRELVLNALAKRLLASARQENPNEYSAMADIVDNDIPFPTR